MELIPVLDLAHGVAVHAIAGDRSRYDAVHSVLAPGADGDAVALARAYRTLPGAVRCYVADLDAIAGNPPQADLIRRLHSAEGFDGPLLLDAGVHSLATLEALPEGIAEVVVGLETLRSFAALAQVAGRARVTFSLDLRNDVPLARPELLQGRGAEPVELSRAALEAGVESLIVLDVGRVGRGVGVNLDLVSSLRRAFPAARLLAGGGVRDEADVAALENHGCDGVLIATALHRGTLASWARPVPSVGDERGAVGR